MTAPLDRPRFSVAARLAGRTVAVVGGRSRAQRCTARLLESGARVRILAADVGPTIAAMAGDIEVCGPTWAPEMLDGVSLLMVTGDDPALEGAAGTSLPEPIRAAAAQRGILVADVETQHGDTASPRAARDLALGGTVALVGGGPGDDGLLTLRGRELLRAADVVVADRLAPQSVLAELDADVEIIDAAKIPYGRQMPQDAINAVLVDRARAGHFVVRFKGGDNFLFGRGYEEAMALAAEGIPCFAVPGVTSAFSGPALGGIPVTHRGVTHEVTVVSGHVPPGHPASLVNWQALAQMSGTIVLLMAVKNAPAIAAELVEAGRDRRTPVAVVESASLDTQRRIDSTLDTLAADMRDHQVVPPAIIVIGEVAGLPESLVAQPHQSRAAQPDQGK